MPDSSNPLRECPRCARKYPQTEMSVSLKDRLTLVCPICRWNESVEINTGKPYEGEPYWNTEVKHIQE